MIPVEPCTGIDFKMISKTIPHLEEIKAKIAETIAADAVKKSRPMVGAQFLKFCGKYELNRLSEQSSSFSEFLGAEYPG